MTRPEALEALRLVYQQIDAVIDSQLLDRSQKTMLNIAIGRVAVVGKQLKLGQQQPASVKPNAA